MSDTNYTKPTPQDLAKLSGLGRFLEENREPEKSRIWKAVMFAVMGLLVALNLVIKNPDPPHFVIDWIPGFWPLFGLIFGVVMIFLVKKVVQPLIKRPEDYYGDI